MPAKATPKKPTGKTRSFSRRDPTRTATLRNNLVRAYGRVFRELWDGIRAYVVDDNRLGGARAEEPGTVADVLASVRLSDLRLSTNLYHFPQSAERLAEFQQWLDSRMEAGILKQAADGMYSEISGPYLSSAYKEGRRRALAELKKSGDLDPDKLTEFDLDTDMFGTSFLAPVHVDDLKLLYARDYSALKNISNQMSAQMSQVLAMGMSEGLSVHQIAKGLKEKVGMTRRRAETIARTEIVRAHHQGLWRQYKAAGLKGVVFQVEWLAARDDRMCPECSVLDGRLFKLDDVKESIPLHPNCRCVMIPRPTAATEEELEYEDVQGHGGWAKYHNAVIKPQGRAAAKLFKETGRLPDRRPIVRPKVRKEFRDLPGRLPKLRPVVTPEADLPALPSGSKFQVSRTRQKGVRRLAGKDYDMSVAAERRAYEAESQLYARRWLDESSRGLTPSVDASAAYNQMSQQQQFLLQRELRRLLREKGGVIVPPKPPPSPPVVPKPKGFPKDVNIQSNAQLRWQAEHLETDRKGILAQFLDEAEGADNILAALEKTDLPGYRLPTKRGKYRIEVVKTNKAKAVLQTGEDYVNDSSRETARILKLYREGKIEELEHLHDGLPSTTTEDYVLLDGHHRHAANTMNKDEYITIIRRVGDSDTGKTVLENGDEFADWASSTLNAEKKGHVVKPKPPPNRDPVVSAEVDVSEYETRRASRGVFFRFNELSENETAAVVEFDAGGYSSKFGGHDGIQQFLRKGEAPSYLKKVEDDLAGIVRDLDNAVSNGVLEEDASLFRGLRDVKTSLMLDDISELQPGFEWTDKGFLTASTSKKAAKGYAKALTKAEKPYELELKLKKGQHALPYNTVSISDPDNMVVLPRGVRYRIVSVRGNKIVAEVVEGAPPPKTIGPKAPKVKILPKTAAEKEMARIGQEIDSLADEVLGVVNIDLGTPSGKMAKKSLLKSLRRGSEDLEQWLRANNVSRVLRDDFIDRAKILLTEETDAWAGVFKSRKYKDVAATVPKTTKDAGDLMAEAEAEIEKILKDAGDRVYGLRDADDWEFLEKVKSRNLANRVVAEKLLPYRKAKARAKQALMELMPKEQYNNAQAEVAKKMILRVGGTMPKQAMKKLQKDLALGVSYIPLDMLEAIQRSGVVIEAYPTTGRASYSSVSKTIKVFAKETGNRATLAHEFGHAIDDLLSGGSGTGGLWKDTSFLPNGASKRKQFRKWYQSHHNGKIGTYTNGDGQFFEDNWMHNYEGRIYKSGNGMGSEWIAMNMERYSRAIGRSGGAPGVELKKHMSWDAAKNRYPKLSEFIEQLMNRRVSMESPLL